MLGSQTVSDKCHCQKGNSPDLQLRSQSQVKWKRCEDTQTTRMLAQKQPLIQRVRNSSLVERLCAENLTGLNLAPKLRQCSNTLGRGALYTRRNSSVSGCGVYRSENAGMSSANAVRICMAESLRFLEEGSSAPS